MGRERVTTRVATTALAALIGGGVVVVAAPVAAGAAGRATGTVANAIPVARVAAGCATGKYQKAVEGYLNTIGGYGKLTVDGKQSPADCAAIKKFQLRFDIRPASGLAGPTTNGVAQRLAATNTASCKAKKTGTTVCVDLTHQTMWVMKSGKVYVTPTVTRTGMNGFRTPTGTFRVFQRAKREWSNPYKVWMPYWQRFVGGVGLHQTTTYIHDAWRGSHGCVNLLPADAKKLYSFGTNGMTVKVFGRRPGT